MTELAHLLIRNSAQFQERRRDKVRRLELVSQIDELSTDEIERLLSFSGHRVGAAKTAGF
jgi:hypothetical protein